MTEGIQSVKEAAAPLLLSGKAVIDAASGVPVFAVIDAIRSSEAARAVRMLEARIEAQEEKFYACEEAIRYLRSEMGRAHVVDIYDQAAKARADMHVEALACAYLSGAGLGRGQPGTVQLLDATLGSMTAPHLGLFGYLIKVQLHGDFRSRLRESVKLRVAARDLSVPPAIVQKLAVDLNRLGITLEPNLRGLGGYSGTTAVAVTSFGLELHRYITDPFAYQGDELPVPESPFAPDEQE